MTRLGLCCQFVGVPIRFRTTTAAVVSRLTRPRGLEKLADIARHNAAALLEAMEWCDAHGIGCFRVVSQVLPIITHPAHGYRIEDLPGCDAIVAAFRACGSFARERGFRTTFHPDQFVVLSSPDDRVVSASIAEIEYQAMVAAWIGADVINIHAGGGYGDKPAALDRFRRAAARLSDHARSLLTLENDDVTYTPADLLELCRVESIPLVYDVHHHRCLRDDLSIEEATAAALATWSREPLLHISSPVGGWRSRNPRRHHDFINITDFPACWRGLNVTIEVEAKKKEKAVLRLKRQLEPPPTSVPHREITKRPWSRPRRPRPPTHR